MICNICNTAQVEVKKGIAQERCERCAKRYDSIGNLFIVYKTTEVWAKGNQHYYVWTYEGKVLSAPVGYRSLIGMDYSAAAELLIAKKMKHIDTHHPLHQ